MLRLLNVLALAATVHCATWMTTLDQPFNFTCQHGEFLSHMKSAYNGKTRDRQFSFGCKAITLDANVHKCTWSGFVNVFDSPVVFQCPNDGVMTGIYGIHDNGPEDRRFRFGCCEVQGYVAHACSFTGYRNSFHGLLDYTIPDGFYMRGMESIHDNNQEDRITQFDICKLDRILVDDNIAIG